MPSRPHVQRLVQRARTLAPLRTGFVYPCDAATLQLALASSFAGLVEPVLIGPEQRIRELALQSNVDVSRFRVQNTDDNPRAAADIAVTLARNGAVWALMKGALGNDELLTPVALPLSGLCTERKLSHAHFIDMPSRAEPMLLVDALLNINASLSAKRDMLRNAVDLASALGVPAPHVSLVSGIGVVTPALRSTEDAAALLAMAQEGVFGAATLEGPVTADVALFPKRTKPDGAPSLDVLLAPGMESASMLLRTLVATTGALAAGLVLGARVPIVAPLRSESTEVRMASCVLACLYAQWLARPIGATIDTHAPNAQDHLGHQPA